MQLWDLSDREHPTPLGEPLAGPLVTAAAFTPDGHTLATASDDGTAILWDLTNPTHPRLGDPLTGHTDSVTAVAFAPDGRTLATTSNDRTVILWDLTDRNQPLRLGESLNGHTDSVIAAALHPTEVPWPPKRDLAQRCVVEHQGLHDIEPSLRLAPAQ